MKAFMLLVWAVAIAGCSHRIMEASETHKLHDMLFFLRKNGHYSLKVSAMGVLAMPDSDRGRYLISNDSIYFVNKLEKGRYRTYGQGIIDSSKRSFIFRTSDTAEWREFRLYKISWTELEKRRQRQQGHNR